MPRSRMFFLLLIHPYTILPNPLLSGIGPFEIGRGVLLETVVSSDCDPVRADGAVEKIEIADLLRMQWHQHARR